MMLLQLWASLITLRREGSSNEKVNRILELHINDLDTEPEAEGVWSKRLGSS